MALSPKRTARWLAATSGLSLALATLGVSASAQAYEVRETAGGLPVRWPTSDVTIEVDPSLIDAVPDAYAAATAAALAWTSSDEGAELHVSLAASASSPSVDGHNVIYYIPGYPAAGDALAITLVSYDDVTGAIVDTDVVINGNYPFAVLPASSRPPLGVTPIANEPGPTLHAGSSGALWPLGSSSGLVGRASLTPSGLRFDLVHVLAHETGHVLGLRDAQSEDSDLMFLYSSPGDAARRGPAADDIAGVSYLYAGVPVSSAAGCAAAPVSSSKSPAWPFLGVTLAFAITSVVGRRGRRARSLPEGASSA